MQNYELFYISSLLNFGNVYKFQCDGSIVTYYGKTKRHFKVRMCEHMEISALTGKNVKGDYDFAIQKPLLFYNHAPDFLTSHYQQKRL